MSDNLTPLLYDLTTDTLLEMNPEMIVGWVDLSVDETTEDQINSLRGQGFNIKVEPEIYSARKVYPCFVQTYPRSAPVLAIVFSNEQDAVEWVDACPRTIMDHGLSLRTSVARSYQIWAVS